MLENYLFWEMVNKGKNQTLSLSYMNRTTGWTTDDEVKFHFIFLQINKERMIQCYHFATPIELLEPGIQSQWVLISLKENFTFLPPNKEHTTTYDIFLKTNNKINCEGSLGKQD